MTVLLSGVGQLPREERPVFGRAANETKTILESALQERQEAIAREEMTRSLSTEGVDVTLPGRRPMTGKYHPTTTALREIIQYLRPDGFSDL